MSTAQSEIDRLIEQFDPEASFRRLAGLAAGIVTVLAVGLSGWQLIQATSDPIPPVATFAFGVVMLAIAGLTLPHKACDGSHQHIPLRDWIFALLAAGFSLYLLVFFDAIFLQRPGDHTPVDLMIGVIAIAMVIEATRRTMGIFLPRLAIATVLYGIFGPCLPGGLAHRGYSVPRVVAHLYKGTEGIYGIPVGVVATFVFHFVLFGIMAQLTGLGLCSSTWPPSPPGASLAGRPRSAWCRRGCSA